MNYKNKLNIRNNFSVKYIRDGLYYYINTGQKCFISNLRSGHRGASFKYRTIVGAIKGKRAWKDLVSPDSL